MLAARINYNCDCWKLQVIPSNNSSVINNLVMKCIRNIIIYYYTIYCWREPKQTWVFCRESVSWQEKIPGKPLRFRRKLRWSKRNHLPLFFVQRTPANLCEWNSSIFTIFSHRIRTLLPRSTLRFTEGVLEGVHVSLFQSVVHENRNPNSNLNCYITRTRAITIELSDYRHDTSEDSSVTGRFPKRWQEWQCC